ncbi:toll/interleukin-1 receptor domain-containing protein [candidate division WOR-3 bacterium]|nr:toll/interleukin-1 receptor domain-containing protein [candidate division WOR-3 bacterium]
MYVKTPNRTHSGGNQPHIVIPYNYADHEFAGRLTAALRHDRIAVWIDDIDMSAGAILVNRIQHAARPVDCVIPVISTASAMSNWVQHELQTIMARSFCGRRVRVLPARVDDCALPGFLMSLPYSDFHRNGWSVAYDDLIVAVSRRTGPAPTEPPRATFRMERPARLT